MAATVKAAAILVGQKQFLRGQVKVLFVLFLVALRETQKKTFRVWRLNAARNACQVTLKARHSKSETITCLRKIEKIRPAGKQFNLRPEATL
jgi:hypothetical protein